jgi:hypothetical protein
MIPQNPSAADPRVCVRPALGGVSLADARHQARRLVTKHTDTCGEKRGVNRWFFNIGGPVGQKTPFYCLMRLRLAKNALWEN